MPSCVSAIPCLQNRSSMPKYYFITDSDLIQTQSSSTQAYGSESNPIFQCYNLFQVSVDAKAYAVCEGIMLFQAVAGNPVLVPFGHELGYASGY